MIPKIIHYCWFGKGEMPSLALKCIESWKKYMPEYEIKEWNEDNYDVRKIPYTAQAYDAKKYAFVSDYARFDILYEHGGLYFDTDVEIIKSLTPLIEQGAFAGVEWFGELNAGLGLACPPKMEIDKEVLDSYENEGFIGLDGKMNLKTVVERVSDRFEQYGFKTQNKTQEIKGVKIYPAEYFCPMSQETGIITITENTYSIHHYASSWMPKHIRAASKAKKRLSRLLGPKAVEFLIKKIGLKKWKDNQMK